MTPSARFPAALPEPRTPSPLDAPALRWGVMAPGHIAGRFADALRHTGQQIVAVGSRSAERAEAFAAVHGIAGAYGSYAAVAEDPQVDVVYVAGPHSTHRDQAMLAITAGKHVLVEKAFTRNTAEAAEVIAAGHAAGVLVQEAMWTRFLPHIDVIRQLLTDGVLGDIVTLTADHGQHFLPEVSPRLFDPHRAGGALLDLGVYPLSFASFVLGTPSRIRSTGSLTNSGVDAQVSVMLEYESGAQALVHTTLLAKTPTTAAISGTHARIEIPGPFYAPQAVRLITRDGDQLTWAENRLHQHEGLCYQATSMARAVAEGRTENPLMPPVETLAIMGTMDEIRRQVGVVFPGEWDGSVSR